MAKRKLKKKNLFLFISIVIVFIAILTIFYINVFGFSSNLKIKLIGKNKVTINYGEKYNDKGVKAFYKDKNITKNVKIKNNLNVDKIGTYEYVYSIKYKKISKSIKRTIIVVDKIKPEIVLNGNETINIFKGVEYKDEGAKATDLYDGDLTDKIKVTGEVNVNEIGEYTLTYTVYDKSKNTNSITRKVIVSDKPAINNNTNSSGVIGYTSKGYKIERRNGIVYINDILVVNKTYDLPSSYNPGGLLDVFNSNFNTMQNDASSQGISLRIISGFRSYNTQVGLYNRYVNRDGKALADTYSARAGHSEHQTGLAADINSLDQSFEYTAEGKWLNDNCYKYGFIIRFVKNKDNITGYMFEPWHIRYVGKDLAKILYNNGNWITLEEYLGITSQYN